MRKTTHKTRLQWYNTLPEPIRTMAIENTDKSELQNRYEHLYLSISTGFLWGETKQGAPFWKLVSSGEFDKALSLLKLQKPFLYDKYTKPAKPEFKHDKENSVANLRTYFQQQKRLQGNSDVIFNFMLQGVKMDGVKCIKLGMSEYRKRFAEIRDYLQKIGITVQTESAKNGLKSHYLAPDDITKIKKALKLK